MTRLHARSLGTAAAVASALACSEATGSEAGRLNVRFAPAPPGAAPAPALSAALAPLPVEGSNGTLTIEEIWLVADEFRLERVEGACEESGGESEEDCARFEAPPAFVAVSLDGAPPGTVSAAVAVGSYEELKFETRAPRADGALLAEIRGQFADWPEEASLFVVGTFTPAQGGDPVPFRVYFHAEVLVELAFDEPLVVAGGDDASVAVLVNPQIWFVEVDGTVVDLTQFDFDGTGEVVEFEAKFKEGFTKIEVD